MLHAIETRTRHASVKSFRYYEKKPVRERIAARNIAICEENVLGRATGLSTGIILSSTC